MLDLKICMTKIFIADSKINMIIDKMLLANLPSELIIDLIIDSDFILDMIDW